MKALQTRRKANAWAIGLSLGLIVAAIAPLNIVAEKEKEPAPAPAEEAKPPSPTRQQTEERVRVESLEKLKLELAELSLSFTDQHPSVVATKKKIALLEKELDAAASTPDGPPATGTAAAMSYYLQHPELMKRYFPQQYAALAKSGAANAGTQTNNGFASKPAGSEPRDARLQKAAKESHRVYLRPKTNGVVEKIWVKRGDHVKAGYEIIRFEERQASIRLRTAKAEFDIAEAENGLEHVTCEQQIAELQSKKDMPPSTQAAELQKLKLQLKRADAELELAKAKYETTSEEINAALSVWAPSDGVIDQLPTVGQRLDPDSAAVGFVADPPQ